MNRDRSAELRLKGLMGAKGKSEAAGPAHPRTLVPRTAILFELNATSIKYPRATDRGREDPVRWGDVPSSQVRPLVPRTAILYAVGRGVDGAKGQLRSGQTAHPASSCPGPPILSHVHHRGRDDSDRNRRDTRRMGQSSTHANRSALDCTSAPHSQGEPQQEEPYPRHVHSAGCSRPRDAPGRTICVERTFDRNLI